MHELAMLAHITVHEIPDLLTYLGTGMGVGTGVAFVFLFQSITSSPQGLNDENGEG